VTDAAVVAAETAAVVVDEPAPSQEVVLTAAVTARVRASITLFFNGSSFLFMRVYFLLFVSYFRLYIL